MITWEIFFTPDPKGRRSRRSYNWERGELPNNRSKTNYNSAEIITNSRNESDKWPNPLKWPHKKVIKAEGAQIKADISEPPLENNDNYRWRLKR
jgi:hypothetical protein